MSVLETEKGWRFYDEDGNLLDDAMEKGRQRQFSSRSEAGRYAANIRWASSRGGEVTAPARAPHMQAIADEAAALRMEMDLLAADAPAVLESVPRLNPARNKAAYEDPSAVVFIDTRTNEVIPSARVAALHDRTIALGHKMRDEAVTRTRKEIDSLGGQGKVNDEQTSAIYAKHMQAVVSEVRPVGGEMKPAYVGVGPDLVRGGAPYSLSNMVGSEADEKALITSSMQSVSRVLPTDWVNMAATQYLSVQGIGSSGASFFRPDSNELRLAGSKTIAERQNVKFGQSNHAAVMAHEYTHFVASNRPAVRVMEMSFVSHRSHSFQKGAELAPLADRIKAGGAEGRSGALMTSGAYIWVLRDQFTSGYSGRLYSDPYKPTMGFADRIAQGVGDNPKRPNTRHWNTEVLSTGVEQVFTGNVMRYDRDHLAFAIGVMATA